MPKLGMFDGELSMAFDPVEALRATVITVTPLMAGDEPVRAAVEAANEFLRIPGLFSAPAVAEALGARVREAWQKGKRALPAGYLEAQVEQALLERRAYRKREVLGATHLKGLLGVEGEAVPAYLPEALARKLPLAARFRAKMVAEVHPAVGAGEGHEACLKAMAVGRVIG